MVPLRGVTRSISRSGGAGSQGQRGAGHRGVTGRGELRADPAVGGEVVGTGMGEGVWERAEEWKARRRRRAGKRRIGGGVSWAVG